MKQFRTMMLAVLCAAWCLAGVQRAEASHFRYGTLSWVLTGNPGEVQFRLLVALRRDSISYGSFPGGVDDYPETGDIISEEVGQTALNFGDGGLGTDTLEFRVVAYSVADNWLIGEALDPVTRTPGIRHTYSGAGPFLAGIDTCCRISSSLLNNRGGGDYVLTTIVNPTGNNSSPVSSLVPIVVVPQSSAATFLIPASDVDNDRLRWRLSTSAEAGGGSGPVNFSINPNTGVAVWNNLGLRTTGFYTVQVIVEDLDDTGAVKSRTPVDFLLMISGNSSNLPPTCNITGVDAGSPVTAIPGTALTFTITGTDPDPGDTLLVNTAGLPPGATMTPLLPTSGPSGVSSVFNWTPAANQAGTYVVQYSVADSAGGQSLCSLIINVQTNVTLTKNTLIQGTNVSFGEEFAYELTFDTYSSANAAVDLKLVDPLPEEVDFVSMTTNGAVSATYDPVTRTATWNFGTWPPLSAGAVNYLTVRINTNAVPGATIVNQASIISSNLPPVARRDRNPRCPTCPPGIIPTTNTCPTAVGQTLEVIQDAPFTFTVTGSDVDGDALTYSVIEGPQHGSLAGTPPTWTYTPAAGYIGADSIKIGVSDGSCTEVASIQLDVKPDNQPPTAKIQIEELVDMTPDYSSPVLIACNWWNVCYELDGSLSSDPDGDALSYYWFLEPSVVPFATTVTTFNCLEVGTHTILLTVTDPSGQSDTDTKTVEVVTAPLAIELLIEKVNQSGLPRKTKRELATVLQEALRQAGREKLRETQQTLSAFERKVRAQVAPTSPTDATKWIRWSQAISSGIEGCLKPGPKPKIVPK